MHIFPTLSKSLSKIIILHHSITEDFEDSVVLWAVVFVAGVSLLEVVLMTFSHFSEDEQTYETGKEAHQDILLCR